MKPKLEKLKRVLTGPAADWAVRILVVISTAGALVTGYAENKTSSCLRTYIQASSGVSAEDRRVVDQLVNSIVNAKTRDDTLNALNMYKAQRQVDESRRRAVDCP